MTTEDRDQPAPRTAVLVRLHVEVLGQDATRKASCSRWHVARSAAGPRRRTPARAVETLERVSAQRGPLRLPPSSPRPPGSPCTSSAPLPRRAGAAGGRQAQPGEGHRTAMLGCTGVRLSPLAEGPVIRAWSTFPAGRAVNEPSTSCCGSPCVSRWGSCAPTTFDVAATELLSPGGYDLSLSADRPTRWRLQVTRRWVGRPVTGGMHYVPAARPADEATQSWRRLSSARRGAAYRPWLSGSAAHTGSRPSRSAVSAARICPERCQGSNHLAARGRRLESISVRSTPP